MSRYYNTYLTKLKNNIIMLAYLQSEAIYE